MSMNYRLADMQAQIKNGQQAQLATVRSQASKLLGNVLEVLKDEGYINDYKRSKKARKVYFEIELRYYEGEKVIKEMECISKPGRRVYSEISEAAESA